MGKYTAAHANPSGPGDARPTASQIIQDNDLEGKLTGKVIVITGVGSGIGTETAQALATAGATLFLTARDTEKALAALNGILEPGRVSLVEMDNTSFVSVRSAASTILSQSHNRINILICNAGVMGLPNYTLTPDAHETHFQTNHLAHFLLFQLLKPALLASASPAFHSRVITVSSSAHRSTSLPQNSTAGSNYNFELVKKEEGQGKYDPHRAYANSKLANIYMANELDRRYSSHGLHGISIHPGAVGTAIGRHMTDGLRSMIKTNPHVMKILKSVEQGAATTVYAAVSSEWEGRGGRYLEDCEEAVRGGDDGQVFGVGWVRQTFDVEGEGRLWRESARMVGVGGDVRVVAQ